MQLRNKIILSVAVSGLLFLSGCSGDDEATSSGVDGSNNGETTSLSVLGGVVDLGTNSVASPLRAVELDCGTGASVQVYAVDDIEYETPLLTLAEEINLSDCSFDIRDTDFKDKTLAGVDKQYLIRTIVQNGLKKIELSAAKLSTGSEVGRVDPVATMIKERFTVAITSVKDSMKKLISLGVTEDAIADAVKNIVVDFEKNLENTVEDLKADIEAGTLKIDLALFATEQTFETSFEDAQVERNERSEVIIEQLKTSSAADTFVLLDSAVKKQQLDNIVVDENTLRSGLDAGLAGIKYGIIESFVRMGLPVHDGNGNIIIFIPIDPLRQGELPGKAFKLYYTDSVSKEVSSVGTDMDIRLINPSTDLSKVSGNEGWFRDYVQNKDTIIPAAVIDAMIVGKDNKITMQDLGKVLNKVTGGDGTIDSFVEAGMYNIAMSDSVQTSVENIVNVFKNDFVKRNFVELMWQSTDLIFSQLGDLSNNTQVISDILDMPFIVKGGETSNAFIERLGANEESLKYIVDELGSTLANGIPTSDEDTTLLQFKTGTTITTASAMKPLASLAMINLFMEAKGGSNDLILQKEPLTNMFGWLEESNSEIDANVLTQFQEAQVWTLNFTGEAVVTDPVPSSAPSLRALDETLTLNERAAESTELVLTLMRAISGKEDIQVERDFADMIKNFSTALLNIEEKSADAFNFKDEFRGDLVDFGEADTQSADVKFQLQNFDGETVQLDAGDNLVLVPIFTNVNTYEWKSAFDKNVSLSLDAGSYVAKSFNVYNPESRFDEAGNVDETGEFVSTSQFDLMLIKADGEMFPIATLPIFPGINNLDYPFYYDSSLNYGSVPVNGDPGLPSGGFFEHGYLEASGDLFFPMITKLDGTDVGESILAYNIETKKFTRSLKNGVVSDASMKMTLLYKNYEDAGSTPEIIEEIALNDVIGAGAFLQLELSGPQIKTQTIEMNILYVGSNGEVEYELSKAESFDAIGDPVPVDPTANWLTTDNVSLNDLNKKVIRVSFILDNNANGWIVYYPDGNTQYVLDGEIPIQQKWEISGTDVLIKDATTGDLVVTLATADGFINIGDYINSSTVTFIEEQNVLAPEPFSFTSSVSFTTTYLADTGAFYHLGEQAGEVMTETFTETTLTSTSNIREMNQANSYTITDEGYVTFENVENDGTYTLYIKPMKEVYHASSGDFYLEICIDNQATAGECTTGNVDLLFSSLAYLDEFVSAQVQ